MKCWFSANMERGDRNQQSPISPWFISNLSLFPTNISGVKCSFSSSTFPLLAFSIWQISEGLMKDLHENIMVKACGVVPEPFDLLTVPSSSQVVEPGLSIACQKIAWSRKLFIFKQLSRPSALLHELLVILIWIKLFDFVTAVAHFLSSVQLILICIMQDSTIPWISTLGFHHIAFIRWLSQLGHQNWTWSKQWLNKLWTKLVVRCMGNVPAVLFQHTYVMPVTVQTIKNVAENNALCTL